MEQATVTTTEPAARIARILRDEYGYSSTDDHVVVDDLAAAAKAAGVSYDLRDGYDLELLDEACRIALSADAPGVHHDDLDALHSAFGADLFIHDNGEVACGREGHGGQYLNSAVANDPGRDPFIHTPLGTWSRVEAREVVRHGLTCEGCR